MDLASRAMAANSIETACSQSSYGTVLVFLVVLTVVAMIVYTSCGKHKHR